MAATIVPTLLNRKNYDIWSSRIKSYFVAENLWNIVEGTHDREDETLRMKDAKALYAIKNSCGDDAYKIIEDASTAHEAWFKLQFWKPSYYPSSVSTSRHEIDQRILEWTPIPTRTPTHRDARQESAMEEGRHESNANNIRDTFIKYVDTFDWDKAINLLRQHPSAGSATNAFSGTALHMAILPYGRSNVRIIEQLVDLMEKEDLEIQDRLGYTALYYLIKEHPERVEVAKRMVAKNDKLLTILPHGKVEPLFVVAEGQEKGERMARYLHSLAPRQPLRVCDGAQLISLGFRHGRFDIAWDLIHRYPYLAVSVDYNGEYLLAALASINSAFLSGCRLNFLEKLIYYGIRIKPLPPINEDQKRPLSNQNENQRHLISSVLKGLFRGLVTNLQKLLGISHIYQMKLVHERVKQFLPLMCEATNNMGAIVPLYEALCVAAKQGHAEYITHFCRNQLNNEKNNIHVDHITNEKNQSLFQIAAEYRLHKVYNLIYVFGDSFQVHYNYGLAQASSYGLRNRLARKDSFGNNMLHTVASITPLSHIDHIQGAALQMQRELQWFKEVESVADPNDRGSRNYDNKTPREVFVENHKEMGKEAEMSLKETSTSCTVVGALIVTIMFAATFTIFGENNEKTGLPFNQKGFHNVCSL